MLPRPPRTALTALPLVTVDRINLAPAQAGQLRGGILLLAVDVEARAELLHERLLVFAARDRDGLEAHLRGELDAQVAEPADAEDRHRIAGPRAAVSKRVEGSHAPAHQGRRIHRGNFVRDMGEAPEGDD